MRRTYLIGLGLIALPCLVAAADPPMEAADTVRPLVGVVRDAALGGPVAGVDVRVGDATMVTNADGRFLLRELAPGTHDLLLEHPCYFPVTVALKVREAGDGSMRVTVGLPHDPEVGGTVENRARTGCEDGT